MNFHTQNVSKKVFLFESERLKIKMECSDGNIDFNLQKLMTHPSLQMPVERLLLSFLVSRD